MAISVSEAFVTLRPDMASFEPQMRGWFRAHGAAIVALGAAAISGGLIAAITKPAAAVEQQLNILQATSGATGDQMARLAALARTLGQDLSLPATSSKDAAEAMTELAKAGLSVNDIIGAAKGVLQLSAAGQLSNAAAAQVTANALNAFRLKGTDAVRVADLLAAAANASSSEVVDLGNALTDAGGVFAASGFKIEELVAAVAELSNAGVAGSEAGTQLRVALSQLQAPSKIARDLMEKVGFSAYDAAGNMKSFRDILIAAQKATAGMTQEARDFFLGEVFGTHAITGINILLAQGVGAYDAMTAAVTRNGAAADLAAARNKGLTGAIDGLKSAVSTLAIDLGTKLLPTLTGWVRGLAGAVNSLDGIADSAAAMGRGIGTAFGLAGDAIKNLGDIVKSHQTLFAAAAIAAGAAIVVALGPASIAAASIAFLTADLVAFNTDWQAVFDGLPVPVLRAMQNIMESFSGFAEAFRITVNLIIGGFNLILKASNAVAKATHIALAGMAQQAGDFKTAAEEFQAAKDVAQFDMLPTLPADFTVQLRDAINNALIAATNIPPKTFHGRTRDQLLGIADANDATDASLKDALKQLSDASKATAPSIDDLIAATRDGKAPMSDLEKAIQDLADRTKAAAESIAQAHTSEVVDAFFKAVITGADPDAAIAKVRAAQAEQDTIWDKLVGQLHDKLGVQVPDEFRAMWDSMVAAQKKNQTDLTNGWRQALKARLEAVGRLLPNGFVSPNAPTGVDQSITIAAGAIVIHTDAAGRIDRSRLVADITDALVKARQRAPLSEGR